jgi:hypothetical protein
LQGRSLLVVDLELVHVQSLYLELLDLEPPDNRTSDRQTPDRQGADGTSPDRADANRAELLQATTAPWGPPERELEPVHADPPSTDDQRSLRRRAGPGKRPAGDGPTPPAGMRPCACSGAVGSGGTWRRGRGHSESFHRT